MWVVLVHIALLFWAITNVGDKYIVGKHIRNPYVYLVWLTMIGVVGVLIIPFVGFVIPTPKELLFLGIASSFYFFGGFPYIKAIQMEEVTRINIWWNLIPLFSLLFGLVLFGEVLSPVQFVSFIILITGAFVGSLHAKQKKIRLSRAFVLMIIAAMSYAVYGVLLGHVSKTLPFAHGYVWIHIIMFFETFILFLWPQFRKDFQTELKKINPRIGGFVVGVSLTDHVGLFFHQWAIALSPSALVFAFEGSQTIFVFLIATFLTLFYPHIVKEEIDKRNVFLKLVAMLFMIIGIVILSFD